MFNLYMTSETENKLRTVYSNIKNFYILDIQKFIKGLGLDMSKSSSIFLVNEEIEKLILTQSKLKKYKGIIYVNKNLSEDIYKSFKEYFSDSEEQIKYILIDNSYIPKHSDIMQLFDQVIFYSRFKKNKIIECEGFSKTNNSTTINNIMMEDE